MGFTLENMSRIRDMLLFLPGFWGSGAEGRLLMTVFDGEFKSGLRLCLAILVAEIRGTLGGSLFAPSGPSRSFHIIAMGMFGGKLV